jgi:type IV pilus assembly protein PilQ
MTYEARIDGNDLLLALVPSATTQGGTAVEHFAKAIPSVTGNAVRDIAFRRGKDGEGRITVDLTDVNAGIDIKPARVDIWWSILPR